MPVDSDEAEEYRVHKERAALLKSLGISSDEESLRALGIASMGDAGGRAGRGLSEVLEGDPGWVPADFHVNMLRLLRVQVLQNELIIRMLRRIEKALKTQAKPVNPADWK